MKALKYLLIVVFIGSILISAIPKSFYSNQTITLECLNTNPSFEKLNKSATIIKARLDDFNIKDAELSVNEASSCINLSIKNQNNLSEIVALATSKGKIGFHETFDRIKVINDLGIDKQLASKLNIPIKSKEITPNSGIYGYCKKEQQAEVDLYLKEHYISKPNNGINFFWSAQPNKQGDYYLYLIKPKSLIDNSFISESTVNKDVNSNSPYLFISFNEAGKSIFRNLTRNNINKPIAIVLDKKVLSAPIVRQEIIGGRCVITGDFTIKDISILKALLNNEELPLDFKIKN